MQLRVEPGHALAQATVFLRLLGLTFQRLEPLLQRVHDGIEPFKVGLGSPQAAFCLAPTRRQADNPCGFFEDLAPVDRLGELLEVPELAAFRPDRWFEERDEIKRLIRDRLVQRGTSAWLELLEPAGIWTAPVLDWPALRAEPAFTALQPIQSVRSPDGETLNLTRCPIRIDGEILNTGRPAPRLGAHRQSIDREQECAT